MSSMSSLTVAVSNVSPTFTSIAESDPQDIIFDIILMLFILPYFKVHLGYFPSTSCFLPFKLLI